MVFGPLVVLVGLVIVPPVVSLVRSIVRFPAMDVPEKHLEPLVE